MITLHLSTGQELAGPTIADILMENYGERTHLRRNDLDQWDIIQHTQFGTRAHDRVVRIDGQDEDIQGDLLGQLREAAITVESTQLAWEDAIGHRKKLLIHAANVRRTMLAGTSLETIAAAGGVTTETLRKIRKK